MPLPMVNSGVIWTNDDIRDYNGMNDIDDLDSVPALRLLKALDALVRRDMGPSGFQGTTALGVRTEKRDFFWICRSVGGTVETWFTEAPPGDADAVLVLGVVEADNILNDRELPEDPELELRGDAGHFDRLFNRYLRDQSPLGLRAAIQKKNPIGAHNEEH